jgi:hypothetical protein
MHEYSVSVALFDFLPVLATALALSVLARAITGRFPALAWSAWTGALLVPLGGLCKASWKLIVALRQLEVVWLENLLFVLMAPGFVLMAFSMFHARRALQAGDGPAPLQPALGWLALWLALPLLGALLAAAYAPDSRLWFFWLLGCTTVANIALLVNAAQAAHRGGLGRSVTVYFVLNFAATLALSGLARLPPGEATAWTQEAVNLFAQLALLLGCWQLARYIENPIRRMAKP